MTAKKIFFSYSRADGFDFARRLALDLKKKGFDVWIDQEDIKAGLQWDTEIEKALECCDCVLFLETEKSVVSNHVLDEVYYALEQNKKVIPLIYVDSKTPFRLNRLQHIDFTKNYDTGFELLVAELEGYAPPLTYGDEEKKPGLKHKKPFVAKSSQTFLFIACLAVIVAVMITLSLGDKNNVPAETKGAVAFSDTLTTNAGMILNEPEIATSIKTEEDKKSKERSTPKESRNTQEKKTSLHSGSVNTGKADPVTNDAESKLANLNEAAGNWRLIDMEPKAQSHRGYLKIEVLDENKVAVKSYMQFYYPESKASSYLTVFNAFANCGSCALNKEMKLTAEDIAVGSRTIKTLTEDQPDGKKAGEVILDASANKSVGGTVTLHFIDNNNAFIKVKQPRTITLANELMLEPFVYTFRFKKNE